jgi:hypothetical protein
VIIEFRYLEGEYGDNANFGVSKLVKGISCACEFICNNTWISINTNRIR